MYTYHFPLNQEWHNCSVPVSYKGAPASAAPGQPPRFILFAHRRKPTTARREHFELLDVSPGPFVAVQHPTPLEGHERVSLKGLARTQIPTNRNDDVEFPTFGEIAGVNHSLVQWSSLALEEPPS